MDARSSKNSPLPGPDIVLSSQTVPGPVFFPQKSKLKIERLGPQHLGAITRHLLRLDPDSRAWRFCAPLGDAAIRAYARRIAESDVILLAWRHRGSIRALGEMHETGVWWRRQAELAFSVEPAWRGHGIGKALFHQLLLRARNRFVSEIHLTCLPGNAAMRHIAAGEQARLTIAFSQVDGTLNTELPNFWSYLEEMRNACPRCGSKEGPRLWDEERRNSAIRQLGTTIDRQSRATHPVPPITTCLPLKATLDAPPAWSSLFR